MQLGWEREFLCRSAPDLIFELLEILGKQASTLCATNDKANRKTSQGFVRLFASAFLGMTL